MTDLPQSGQVRRYQTIRLLRLGWSIMTLPSRRLLVRAFGDAVGWVAAREDEENQASGLR
jgi:hypothetical protein